MGKQSLNLFKLKTYDENNFFYVFKINSIGNPSFKFEVNNFNEINNFPAKLKLKENNSRNSKYNLRNSEILIKPASKTANSEITHFKIK
ncbi:hypothetical protein BpHYR1_050434 [Brachionus plicatilis]|uniref:Uncharacterized protein n=1 Tax=Brachionus plicatilis TaxID=10195 RepID=A0A3M7T003_BRAPC|nr:hypothetical protein BpHYR1_050434 [Brachionus plicatilis]